MELRKQKEIEYYQKEAEQENLLSKLPEFLADLEKLWPFFLDSYLFLSGFLKDKCRNKKILDYGCGNGFISVWLAKYGAEVIGIDLSEKYLDIARKRAEIEKAADKIKFLLMDCEDLKFPDNYFDIIFDRGVFSSLDLEKALPGLNRVLKPDGFLIGVETLGHNPLTNLKRKINRLVGRRTEWAERHILKMKDFKEMEKYFSEIEIHFFHLVSWLAFPFFDLPGGRVLLKLLGQIDKIFLALPFLKKLSFKVIFILSKPITASSAKTEWREGKPIKNYER